MIPKIIHYCWFGGNPLPPLAQKCIKSWKKYCPDYEIVRWDESNFDIANAPLYVKQACTVGKWAFVSDYARLIIVYQHGGIYLDTDVELLKNLDPLLINESYFGREDDIYVNTGLGFGAEKGTRILKELAEDYQDIPFVRDDGSFDMLACPIRNHRVFEKYGLKMGNGYQILSNGTAIYPIEYFNPKNTKTNLVKITCNTYSIHDYSASWYDEETLKSREKWRRKNRIQEYKRIPYKILRKLLGDKLYSRVRTIVRRNRP